MKAFEAAGDGLYAEQQKDQPAAGKVRADGLAVVAESAPEASPDAGTSGDRYQVVVHASDQELEDSERRAKHATEGRSVRSREFPREGRATAPG